MQGLTFLHQSSFNIFVLALPCGWISCRYRSHRQYFAWVLYNDVSFIICAYITPWMLAKHIWELCESCCSCMCISVGFVGMIHVMANKSGLVTYLLWMTLGWFGIHHLYLRRYRHGFVWLWTLGGCCGLGWLLEFCRLSSYIDTANNTVGYGHRRKVAMSFNWKRFAGGLLFSMVLGVLSVSAVPKHILTMCPMLSSLAAVFIAAG